ncbi:MAG: type II toxin-antitoxin system Phd/YefM family antitoxin [Sterolibacterium sp.]
MNTWAVQDAKARFSELLDACVSEGPQVVTRRGNRCARSYQGMETAARRGAPVGEGTAAVRLHAVEPSAASAWQGETPLHQRRLLGTLAAILLAMPVLAYTGDR